MPKTKAGDSIIKQIKEGWFIIFFVGGLIVSWTNINGRLSTVEAKTEAQQIQIVSANEDITTARDEFSDAVGKLNDTLIRVETTLVLLKESIASAAVAASIKQ